MDKARRFARNLDWNLLRTYLSIVEQGGITAAAHELGLKQPTISAALQRLEETVGQRLIERGPRLFQPTAAGQALYAEARALFDTVAELPYRLGAAQEGLRGHVSIALASHVVSPHFDAALAAFVRANPAVTFGMTVHPSPDIVAMVREGRATMGVCLLDRKPADLTCNLLFTEVFQFYCGPAHPAFGRQKLGPGDWQALDFVSFQTETHGGALSAVVEMRQALGLIGAPRGVCASLHELKRMVLAGLGVAAMPAHAVRDEVRAGRLWPLPSPVPGAQVAVYLVTRSARRVSQAEQRFISEMAAMLERTPEAERRYHGGPDDQIASCSRNS